MIGYTNNTAKTCITLRPLPLVLPTSGPIPCVLGCGLTSHFVDSKIPILAKLQYCLSWFVMILHHVDRLQVIQLAEVIQIIFSAPEPKAQVHYCDHALSVVRRPSVCLSVRPSSVVNFPHFRLLLWNRWTEFNETWEEARFQRPLPSLCFSGRS